MLGRKEIRVELMGVANGTVLYEVGVATYVKGTLDHYETNGRYPTQAEAWSAAQQLQVSFKPLVVRIRDLSANDEQESVPAMLNGMVDALVKKFNEGDADALNAESARKLTELIRMTKEWTAEQEAENIDKKMPVFEVKPAPELTATCVMNLGMEDRFDEGVSYVVELLPDKDMLLATDRFGKPVEVMRERFKLDGQKRELGSFLADGAVGKSNSKTNFEVHIEAKLKALDEKIEKLLAVVGKYDKLKNPDKVKEYRDALAAMDPLQNERDKLEADERRFKAGHFLADGTTSKPRCETCVKWSKDSGSETVGLCLHFGHRDAHCHGSCSHYQPLAEKVKP